MKLLTSLSLLLSLSTAAANNSYFSCQSESIGFKISYDVVVSYQQGEDIGIITLGDRYMNKQFSGKAYISEQADPGDDFGRIETDIDIYFSNAHINEDLSIKGLTVLDRYSKLDMKIYSKKQGKTFSLHTSCK